MLNWRLNRISGFCRYVKEKRKREREGKRDRARKFVLGIHSRYYRRPEDNIQPEDVDWALDLEMLEQEDGQSTYTPSTHPEKMLERVRSTSSKTTFSKR